MQSVRIIQCFIILCTLSLLFGGLYATCPYCVVTKSHLLDAVGVHLQVDVLDCQVQLTPHHVSEHAWGNPR